MGTRIIILIFCIVDLVMGFWCLTLSLQNLKIEKLKEKNKNGKQ